MREWTLAALSILALGTVAAPASATMLPGGGSPPTSDCYVTLDVTGSKAAAAPNLLECQDGDPTCDQDGACNNSCRFRVAVCIDQPDVPGCTAPALLQSVTGRVKGAPLPVPTPPSGTVCADSTDVDVPQKPATRRGERPGKVKVVLVAIASSARPKRDKDRVRLVCLPRPAGDPCPPQTTTTTSTTGTTASTSSVTSTTALSTVTTTSTSSTTSTSVLVSTLCCQATGACLDAAVADAAAKCAALNGTVAPAGQMCDAVAGMCGATKVHAANCCECPATVPPFPHPQYCFETNNSNCGPVCVLTAGVQCGPVTETCGGP